jgi:hypothetical protein
MALFSIVAILGEWSWLGSKLLINHYVGAPDRCALLVGE